MKLLLATPWLAAALLAAFPALRHRPSVVRMITWAVAVALGVGGLAVALGDPVVWDIGRWLGRAFPIEVRITFAVDPLARVMGSTVGGVAAAILIYASAYMQAESPADYGRFFTVVFMFVGAMLGAVFSVQLVALYAFWEVMGLASYLLIGFYHGRSSARRAAVRAFWVTRLGDVGFLTAVIVAAWNLPSLAFGDWPATLGAVDPEVRTWVLAGLILGVMGKSAQFPLHIWLPDAMEGPTPVSALVHAATMVAAGVFLLLRAAPLIAATPALAAVILAVGVTTALLGAVQACVQRDLKQVMAMSTISQLGYMVAAAGALAAPAALYHLVTHAAFKALLFLTAGTVAHALGGLDLRQLSGLWRRHRLAAISLLVGGAALAGLPPLSGGLSKELLVAGVWAHAPTAGVLLLAGSALTAFYVGRMWAIVLPSGAAATAANPHHDHGHGSGSDGPMSLGLALLLAGTLLLGLLQTPILNAVAGHAAHPPTALAMGEPALALVGLLLGWRWGRGAGRDPSGAWAEVVRAGFALPALHDAMYRHALVPLGRALGWLDRYVVDGLVNAVAAATWRITAPLRAADRGSLAWTFAGIWLGWLGLWWWLR